MGELTALPHTPKLDFRGPTSKRREGKGRERKGREGEGREGKGREGEGGKVAPPTSKSFPRACI